MAIIPGEEQYSGIPSPRSGRQIAQYDTTAVQRGLSALGEGIAGFGSQLTKVAENVIIKRQETATYDAEARFQQFRFNEAQRFSDDIRNVPAGGAAQYADNWTAGYRERARQFFDTLPEEVRPDYDLRLFATEREFYANGLEFEQAEMARFTIQQTEQTLNNAVLPQVVAARESPNPQQALEEAIAMGAALITNNPHLTPTEKDVGLLEWRERAQRAFLEGLPAEDRAGWLGTDPVSIADRIIQLESGGNATAANPNSTALGVGQFLEETWLGLLARHRPDLVAPRIPAFREAMDHHHQRAFALDGGADLRLAGIDGAEFRHACASQTRVGRHASSRCVALARLTVRQGCVGVPIGGEHRRHP